MQSIPWAKGIQHEVDPDSNEIYRIECVNWLDGDTLSNATSFVAVVGVTVTVTTISSTAIDFRLTGMTLGAFTSFTLRPVAQTSGRSDDFTIRLIIGNK